MIKLLGQKHPACNTSLDGYFLLESAKVSKMILTCEWKQTWINTDSNNIWEAIFISSLFLKSIAASKLKLCFLVALCCLMVKRWNLEVASPSADRNTGVVLVPCCAWKCVPTAILGGVNISEAPGYHFLWQMSYQWGSQKLLQGLVSYELTAYLSDFDLFLTQWNSHIMKKDKPDKFK